MRTIGLLVICLVGSGVVPAPLAAQDTVPVRLSLAEALRLAEQRHPALAAARSRADIAAAAVTTARQRPNPVVGFSSEGSRPWADGGRSPDQQEVVIEISQEIETGGRRRLRGAAATAGAAAGEASVRDERRLLRLETQRAYFQLVLARSELETARAALTEVDSVITVNRARYQQGEISGGELRRLEVERMRFTDDVLAADLGEKHARAALLSLLGAQRLDAPLDPTDPLARPPAAARGPGDAEALVTRALSSRPDVESARREEERAQSEVQLQRALRLPTLTVGGGYRRDFGAHGLVVSASVPLPAFDRNAGGVARAEAERRQAASQARERERAVSLEVQQATDAVAAARARLAGIESEYLQKAKEARDSALAAYRSGATDLIDYLDAQRAYRDVQRAHQRALFDHRLSLFLLDAAVGVVPGDLQP